jgi:hypothetical protein
LRDLAITCLIVVSSFRGPQDRVDSSP